MRGCMIASSRRRASGSAKTMRAQALAVEPPVGGDDLRPGGANLGQRRLPGLDRLARQLVGVDDRDAARGDQARHRRLSGADAAGQPDEP